MSRRLISTKCIQDVTDDMESFFWVLLYIWIRYLLTDLDSDLLSEFLGRCFCADWRVPYDNKSRERSLRGGDSRARFVSSNTRVLGGPFITWPHQPVMRDWFRRIVLTLQQLTQAQDVMDRDAEDARNAQAMPASAHSVDATAGPCENDADETWKHALPVCDMASHNWFLKTIDNALATEQMWNVGIQEHEGRRTEDSQDHWAKKTTSVSEIGRAVDALPTTQDSPLGRRSRQSNFLVQHPSFFRA
ncbi:hypothetical protein BDV98DRAFT_585275 [Pterulicium gracile]|uniref:Fungal-type protein kinase domain-containing protein n=1 Tax=Pterulicium gracile TaxID=1884261 RepID=A0A5C3QHZ0_9AGAR|nr:hypothetical protein BDV98DRAFT_585275 [Pterula gracilis]